jgi:hypothetical protein
MNWYLELLEVGFKKYIVPQSKAYLESVRSACRMPQGNHARKNPKVRQSPFLDIEYPKGYEG